MFSIKGFSISSFLLGFVSSIALLLLIRFVRAVSAARVEPKRMTRLLRQEPEEISDKRQPFLVGLDPRTGLSNTASFERALITEWKRSARTQRSIAFIFIHVISPGHDLEQPTDAAKNILARLGEVLRNHARRPGDLSAYLDKQRFAVLLAETELDNAHKVAMRLRDALATTSFTDSASEPIGLGVNLAVCSEVPEVGSVISLDLMQDAWTTLEIALQEEVNQVVCLG